MLDKHSTDKLTLLFVLYKLDKNIFVVPQKDIGQNHNIKSKKSKVKLSL
jgi:hypothetical protein